MSTLSEASAPLPASRRALPTRVSRPRSREPGAQAGRGERPLCPGMGRLAWGRLEGHKEH